MMLTGTAAAAAFASTGAEAQSGTTAGTVISNTATASYSVNGVNQTKTSNTATFKVDRKVNLTLVDGQPGNTQVAVGQTGAVLKYTLTNSTNGTQDFLLTPTQGILLGGDNFDVVLPKVYVDSDGDGVYDATKDKLTFVNELAADTSIVIFVVADIPADQSARLANVTLTAQVAAGGDASTTVPGVALSPSTLNDDQQVDVVFADTDTIPRDGLASATLAYEIATRDVALTVVKSSAVISDPVNGPLAPKALPGAVVQYCLIVNNATLLTPANGVNITDTIPTNTTYVPGSITVGGLPVLGACVLGTPMNDSGAAVGGSPYTASYNADTKLITATIPTLSSLQSLGVTFQVTIN
ncbi:DUF11 domain-containing protein [Sphingomonas ginsenosidivorax]|uniref:DUF11 domain-containing protein n=1 Tax=Sphingomonas ginsenosidivorax TaxID=862135 RepID=A0A5C6ULI3_9SPHN|nr:DUF11 domain-containing protein [Sphingomonas ginsenosidivorax]